MERRETAKILEKIGALLSPVILVNAAWFRKFTMLVQCFFAYLALPVLVTFHCQDASNINCSTIVFILEVYRLSLPVSSPAYDVTFQSKKATCLFPCSCVQMVENVSDNLGHYGRSK